MATAKGSGVTGAGSTIRIRDNNVVATLNASESKLSFEQLLRPVSRCILLVLVLVLSTGPLIRKLIAVTILDLAALTVGCFWFMGDLIPCVALVLVLHDALLARKKPLSIRQASSNSNVLQIEANIDNPRLIDIIVITFAALYVLDFIIFISASRHLLDNYRYAFFHIQLLVSIIYMLTKCSKIDLRQVVLNFELFHTQALKVTRALMQLLNHTPRLGTQGAPKTPGLQSQSQSRLEPSTSSMSLTTKSAHRIEESSSTRVSAIEGGPSVAEPDGPSESRRGKNPSMTPRASKSRQLREPTSTSAIRATARKRIVGRRKSRANSGPTGKQSIKQTFITMRNCGKTSRASKRHHCEPTRTVNLNLNMS